MALTSGETRNTEALAPQLRTLVVATRARLSVLLGQDPSQPLALLDDVPVRGDWVDPAPVVTGQPAGRFQCDGRQHCSQMKNCAEATYFIRNCPETKMDGDGDGIPCESQHCD